MKSAILVMGVMLAVPVFGDVTIKQTTSGKGMGVSAAGTTTTYLKGMKMRSEVTAGGSRESQLSSRFVAASAAFTANFE